jgi:hypothetical protein
MAGENYLKIAVTGMCASLLLSACQKDAGPAVTTSSTPKFNSSASSKKGPSVEELTTGMVSATALGKSLLPLDLKFDLGAHPAQGESLEINLALLPQVTGGPMNLQLASTDGFTVADATPFELAAVESGEVYRHTIKVTPKSQGLLLLGVTVAVKHDDVSDSKSFSIPVIVDR